MFTIILTTKKVMTVEKPTFLEDRLQIDYRCELF